jgi:hypothetical protein
LGKKLAQEWLNHVSRMQGITCPKKKKTLTTIKNYWMDTIARPKQAIYWPNFVTRRRRRRRR